LKNYISNNKFIISLLSIGVSIILLIIAFKSCDIANESLRFSKHVYEETQKPLLIMKPAVGKFGNIFQYQILDDSIEVLIQFEIKNIGKRNAIKIRYNTYDSVIFVNGNKYNGVYSDNSLDESEGNKSLSPEQKYYFSTYVTLPVKLLSFNNKADIIEEIKSDIIQGKYKTKISVTLEYVDVYNNKQYLIDATYLLSWKKSEVVNYEVKSGTKKIKEDVTL